MGVGKRVTIDRLEGEGTDWIWFRGDDNYDGVRRRQLFHFLCFAIIQFDTSGTLSRYSWHGIGDMEGFVLHACMDRISIIGRRSQAEWHLLDDWGMERTGSILRGMGGSWCWFYFSFVRHLLYVYKLNIGNYNIIILYLLYISIRIHTSSSSS